MIPVTPQECIHELALDSFFKSPEEKNSVESVTFSTVKGLLKPNVIATSGVKRRLFVYDDGHWNEVLPETPADAAKRGFNEGRG